MDIKEHKKAFDSIIARYGLNTEEKAQEIADYLTKHSDEQVSATEFAQLFSMTEEEAKTFLSFIRKGLDFKESHIDEN